jgi:hypothetical protein
MHMPRVCLVDVMAHPDGTRISENGPKGSAIVRQRHLTSATDAFSPPKPPRRNLHIGEIVWLFT